MPGKILYTHTPVEEVNRITEGLAMVFGDEDPHILSMAFLTFCVRHACENIEASDEQIAAGVTGASEWMAHYAASIDEPIPAEKAN